MSAFVVEDAIINGVVSFLAHTRDLDHVRRIVLTETGCDVRTREGCAALGEAMFKLNCNAVEQRYGEGEAASFRALDYQFQSKIPPSAIQAYKSLQCWHYQCAEGDVPETSLLYATMEKVGAELAHAIVRNLPAYDKAQW